jgi:hypothetical protein
MNTCHLAAIALLAWLLMLPPEVGNGRTMSFAPLAEWKEIDKFDSKAECEHMRKALIKRMPQTAIDTTRCVPDYDPNLHPGEEAPPTIGG